MKALSILLFCIPLLAANMLFGEGKADSDSLAQPKKTNCHCPRCKCTPESHCGCYSDQGCHCPPGSGCNVNS